MNSDPLTEKPSVTTHLPRFRQPQTDPPLATVPSDAPSSPPVSDSSRPATAPAGDSQPASPLPSLEPPAASGRTATSATKPRSLADEKAAARVIGGLLIIGLTSLGVWLSRGGRALRLPTERQRDDISAPLGRIAARYLPAELVDGTLVDVTEAASAAHAYVLDPAGPLVTRNSTPFMTEE